MINIIGRDSTLRYEKSRNNFIIFNHIERCGGTTLDSIFAANGFEMHYVPTVYGWPTVLERIGHSNAPVVISGHAVWGIHEHLPAGSNVWYVTTLREPINLCQSWYTANNQQVCSGTALHDFIHRETYYQNKMTMMLAGGDVDLAHERLLSTYHSFGLLEHFDAYLHDLAECFSFDTVEYRMGNISFGQEEIFSSEDKKVLRKSCAADVELYRRAQTDIAYEPSVMPEVVLAREKQDRVGSHSRKCAPDVVYESLQRGDPQAAITEILATVDYQNIWSLLRLQVLYRLAGDGHGYEGILHRLDGFRPDAMKLDLAVFYAKREPQKALGLLNFVVQKFTQYRTKGVESPLNTVLVDSLVVQALIHRHCNDDELENSCLSRARQLQTVGDEVARCLERQKRRIAYFYEQFL